MKRIMTIAACTAILLTGCSTNMDSGNNLYAAFQNKNKHEKEIKKELNVDYFTKINITGRANVIFTQTNGGKPKVTIVGTSDAVEKTRVSNSGKTLNIGEKNSRGFYFSSKEETKIYISAPDLQTVNIVGSGDFKAKGAIDTDKLKVNITGCGDVEINSLICDDTDFIIVGSGDVKVKEATCNNADIKITGSGDISFSKMTARMNTNISCSGSGDVDIRFVDSGNVTCRVSGSGDIMLKGNIKKLDKRCSGSGDIMTKNLQVNSLTEQ